MRDLWKKDWIILLLKDQGQTRNQESHSKSLQLFSIMHVLHSEVFQNKNLFLCGTIITNIITTSNITITTTNMAYSQNPW